MNQLGFPSLVTPEDIARKKTLGGSIELCIEAADMVPKQVQDALKTDKAQVSRWLSDSEGIVWTKLIGLMDLCGNDAPLLWMLHRRGYDLSSLRRQESEIERELRLLKEENERLKAERFAERKMLSEVITGRMSTAQAAA